jgi:hypothetical protein
MLIERFWASDCQRFWSTGIDFKESTSRNRFQGIDFKESIPMNRLSQLMKPGGPVRQIGLSYRLGIDSWAPLKGFQIRAQILICSVPYNNDDIRLRLHLIFFEAMVRMDKEIPYERRMERVDEVLTGVSTILQGIVSLDEYILIILFWLSGSRL